MATATDEITEQAAPTGRAVLRPRRAQTTGSLSPLVVPPPAPLGPAANQRASRESRWDAGHQPPVARSTKPGPGTAASRARAPLSSRDIGTRPASPRRPATRASAPTSAPAAPRAPREPRQPHAAAAAMIAERAPLLAPARRSLLRRESASRTPAANAPSTQLASAQVSPAPSAAPAPASLVDATAPLPQAPRLHGSNGARAPSAWSDRPARTAVHGLVSDRFTAPGAAGRSACSRSPRWPCLPSI
jgi:hypothetical protein